MICLLHGSGFSYYLLCFACFIENLIFKFLPIYCGYMKMSIPSVIILHIIYGNYSEWKLGLVLISHCVWL